MNKKSRRVSEVVLRRLTGTCRSTWAGDDRFGRHRVHLIFHDYASFLILGKTVAEPHHKRIFGDSFDNTEVATATDTVRAFAEVGVARRLAHQVVTRARRRYGDENRHW